MSTSNHTAQAPRRQLNRCQSPNKNNSRSIRRSSRIRTRTAGSFSSVLLTLLGLATLSTTNVASFQVMGGCRMTVTATAANNEPRKSALYQSSPSSSASDLTSSTTSTTSENKRRSGMSLLFPSKNKNKKSADADGVTSAKPFPFFASATSSDAMDIIDDDVEADYQRRKAAWAARYTSVDALRTTFGSNRNLVWGDLDAATARRLYKTLLPKALLELYNTGVGVHPADLAPLAYQARVAAKLYARERCALPARVAANLYDGFRQWRRYGSFDMAGMSYQQVWNKYAKSILDDEECAIPVAAGGAGAFDGLDESDVTAKICLKILERSCETNQMIDKWVFSSKDSSTGANGTDNNSSSSSSSSNYHNNSPSKALSFRKKRAAMAQRRDLQEVTDQLEHDVRQLLLLSTTTNKKTGKSDSSGESRGSGKSGSRSGGDNVNGDNDNHGAEQAAGASKSSSSLSVRRFRLLRILARSKRRIEAMQQLNTHTVADDVETDVTQDDIDNHQQNQTSMDSSNDDSEQQDNDSKLPPWKDRLRQTTNRRKQWIERDASTIQRRP
jgi:hypothetical protein